MTIFDHRQAAGNVRCLFSYYGYFIDVYADKVIIANSTISSFLTAKYQRNENRNCLGILKKNPESFLC